MFKFKNKNPNFPLTPFELFKDNNPSNNSLVMQSMQNSFWKRRRFFPRYFLLLSGGTTIFTMSTTLISLVGIRYPKIAVGYHDFLKYVAERYDLCRRIWEPMKKYLFRVDEHVNIMKKVFDGDTLAALEHIDVVFFSFFRAMDILVNGEDGRGTPTPFFLEKLGWESLSPGGNWHNSHRVENLLEYSLLFLDLYWINFFLFAWVWGYFYYCVYWYFIDKIFLWARFYWSVRKGKTQRILGLCRWACMRFYFSKTILKLVKKIALKEIMRYYGLAEKDIAEYRSSLLEWGADFAFLVNSDRTKANSVERQEFLNFLAFAKAREEKRLQKKIDIEKGRLLEAASHLCTEGAFVGKNMERDFNLLLDILFYPVMENFDVLSKDKEAYEHFTLELMKTFLSKIKNKEYVLDRKTFNKEFGQKVTAYIEKKKENLS